MGCPVRRRRQEGDIGLVTRVVVVLYFLEAGLMLVVVPWTRFWDRNYFVEFQPLLETALTTPIIRGSVSGLGLVCVGAALVELRDGLRGWIRGRADRQVTSHRRLSEVSRPELREEVCPPSS
jgi:hypothetical protein